MPKPNLVADHIDRDKLNNTRSNLRGVTRAKNNANKNGYGAIKHKYISYSHSGKYIVKIYRTHVGTYSTLKEALQIRDLGVKQAGVL